MAWTFKPAIMVTMKKPLLALLAVAAVSVVAVVIVENTPERRMDRRIDKLLRTYDEPEQFFKRVVDDRDLLGFVLVGSFLKYNGPRCSCGAGAASISRLYPNSTKTNPTKTIATTGPT